MRGFETVIVTWTMLAALVLASAPSEWRPAASMQPHRELVAAVETITERSILGDDAEPLIDALPSHLADTAAGRQKIEVRVESGCQELRRRLGLVVDWEVAEVLTDQDGRVKVRVRFYRDLPGAAVKRPFRGVSFIFRPMGHRMSLVWVGYWDPKTGTWDVIAGS
jgi:hypothetical protein